MRWPMAILRSLFKGTTNSQTSHHLIDGIRGERAAAKFLKKLGHRILARNYKCAGGELDLVTQNGDTIAFVEVKARRSDNAADPLEAVVPVKWSRVERAAQHFRAQYRLEDAPCRFDLVTVVWTPDGANIEHIENAHESRRP